MVGDLTQEETIQKIFALVDEQMQGQLDILVNNAGWCPVQPITDLTIADHDRAFSLDVRALVNMTIHALPYLIKRKGSILNLSSVGATHRAANLSMYVGAKAAVEKLYAGMGDRTGIERRTCQCDRTWCDPHEYLECDRSFSRSGKEA